MKKAMLTIMCVLLVAGLTGQAGAQEVGQVGNEWQDPVRPEKSDTYDTGAAKKKTRLGFSLGTPGALNLVFSQDFPATTLTLTGGGSESENGNAYGFQAGFSLVRSERTRNYKALNLIGGHMSMDGKEWTYGGLEAFLQWRAFFLAPGITVGEGDFTNPQISLQLGFAWAL